MKALKSWAEQPGYPVLNVTVDDKKQILHVSQERFLLKKKSDAATKADEKWLIPINFVTEKVPNFNDTKPSHWLDSVATNPTITGVAMKPGQWVILNKKQTGESCNIMLCLSIVYFHRLNLIIALINRLLISRLLSCELRRGKLGAYQYIP